MNFRSLTFSGMGERVARSSSINKIVLSEISL
jgi:hypothetical protein